MSALRARGVITSWPGYFPPANGWSTQPEHIPDQLADKWSRNPALPLAQAYYFGGRVALGYKSHLW